MSRHAVLHHLLPSSSLKPPLLDSSEEPTNYSTIFFSFSVGTRGLNSGHIDTKLDTEAQVLLWQKFIPVRERTFAIEGRALPQL